jgi:hypothetical protein
VAKPGDTDTTSKPRGLDTISNGIDNADDLVTGNKRQVWILEIAVHDMEIGTADRTGFHLHPQLAGARSRVVSFGKHQGFPELLKNHGFHG